MDHRSLHKQWWYTVPFDALLCRAAECATQCIEAVWYPCRQCYVEWQPTLHPKVPLCRGCEEGGSGTRPTRFLACCHTRCHTSTYPECIWDIFSNNEEWDHDKWRRWYWLNTLTWSKFHQYKHSSGLCWGGNFFTAGNSRVHNILHWHVDFHNLVISNPSQAQFWMVSMYSKA